MNLEDKLLHHRSKVGAHIHQVVDPLITWGVANVATVYGSLAGAEWIKQNATSPEKYTDALAYAAAGAAIIAANFLPFGIRKLTGAAEDFWQNKIDTEAYSDIGHNIGSLLAAGALALSLTTGPIRESFNYHVNEFIQPKETGGMGIEAPLVQELINGDANNLSRENLTGWFAKYTGLRENPENLPNQNDFGNSSEHVWKRKLAKSTDSKEQQIYDEQVRPYQEDYAKGRIKKSSLNELYTTIEDTLTSVKQGIDFPVLVEGLNIPEERQPFYQSLVSGVGADEMLAITLTELFGENGEQNKELANFFLTSAGQKYLDTLPGSATNHAEFGRYQHTKFIINQINRIYANGFRMQDAMSVELPSDITELDGLTHDVVAYTAAIQSLGEMTSSLTDDQFFNFSQRIMKDYTNLAMLVGLPHHSPADARNAARNWASSENPELMPHIKNHRDKRTEQLQTYAKKLKNNFLALNTYFSEDEPIGPIVQTPFSTGNVLELQYVPQQNETASDAAKKFNSWDDSENNNRLPEIAENHFGSKQLEAGETYTLQLRWK